MMPKIIDDTYLGDGVYASFDGYHIVLDLRRQDDTTRISVEPAVLKALDRYRERLDEAIEQQGTIAEATEWARQHFGEEVGNVARAMERGRQHHDEKSAT